MVGRALERYAILAANGGAHVGGLASDGATLYGSMASLVAAPQLFHPMLTPFFSGLAKAQAAICITHRYHYSYFVVGF